MLAEPATAAHITDKLIAGLYPAPAAEGKPLALLPSGTPVEIVERKAGFVQVRVAGGETGWVEAPYVTDEKPAQVMLLEAQARIAELEQQLAARPTAAVDDAGVSTATTAPADSMPLRNDPALVANFKRWLPLLTALGGALVSWLVCWRVINRRVRNRFGGIQF